MLTLPVRILRDADRTAVEAVLARTPIAGAQVAERVNAVGLAWWRLDARVFGFGTGSSIESVCWAGANLIPVGAGPEAIAAFADVLATERRSCSSIVGDAASVLPLWDRLRDSWEPAREIRERQPMLLADSVPQVAADPDVRLVTADQIGLLYPAAVAMYTEEVGVAPARNVGDYSYRARVAELVNARRSYAKIVDGVVVFKADVAVLTHHTAQIQGVWVAPQWRGTGLGTAGVAAVVTDVLAGRAPTVSLYVNDFNLAANRVYQRCGFRQVGLFATVLF